MKTEFEKLRETIPVDDLALSNFFKQRNLPHHYDEECGLWVGYEPLKIASDYHKQFC